jgi:hypothetical protein
MIRIMLAALALSTAAVGAQAQQAMATTEMTAEEQAEMERLRTELRAGKRELVQQNLLLSDAEAARFWPIYDRYQQDLAAINQRMADGVASYAQAYNANALTDAQGRQLGEAMLAIEADELAAKRRMYRDVSRVLPGKKATRYLQMENKIRALIRMELAADIPLVK